jgi:hypothetical protein
MDLQFSFERSARKKLRGMKAKHSTPCPMTGSGRKETPIMRRRFKRDPKWITVRYSTRCAEPNCQTEIKSGERAFYYPNEKALYGTRCGHAEKG